MATFGDVNYNPAQVMLGSQGGSGPYMNPSSGNSGSPFQGGSSGSPIMGGKLPIPPTSPTPTTTANTLPLVTQMQPSNILGPEAVRANGQGPYDQAFRQNLATYAGGQFQRPGGNLQFNPTGNDMLSQPTGGGNAPVPGMGNSLLSMGLGGQPFSYAAPQPAAAAQPDSSGGFDGSILDWIKRLRQGGGMSSGGNFMGVIS
jgi:hypothetical protein